MGLRRLVESFDGDHQASGWRRSGINHDFADVGSDINNAAYCIGELTPAQRCHFERDGEIAIDDGNGGVIYLSR